MATISQQHMQNRVDEEGDGVKVVEARRHLRVRLDRRGSLAPSPRSTHAAHGLGAVLDVHLTAFRTTRINSSSDNSHCRSSFARMPFRLGLCLGDLHLSYLPSFLAWGRR